MLHRLLEQQLVTKADPEDRRPPTGQLDDALAQPRGGQPLERRPKRPHPRKHDAVRLIQSVRVSSELWVCAGMNQRAFH
jgi:hypothetical protein